jgi:NADH dehydrogenase FAD-containing subunit
LHPLAVWSRAAYVEKKVLKVMNNNYLIVWD